MNTYVWRRWRELDQLVRHMTLANPSFCQRVADAPPRAVHVYALVMRSPFWARLDALAAACQAHAGDRLAQFALLKDAWTATDGESLRTLASVLDRTNLNDLLEIAVEDAPSKLLVAFDRCGDIVHEPEFYVLLMRLLRNPAYEPVLLARNAALDMDLLKRLLASRHLGPLTLKAFAEGRMSLHNAEIMQSVIDAVVNAHGEAVLPIFTDALARWNRANPDDHCDRMLNRLPVPPAPWKGNNCLTPVNSTAGLKAVGRRFRNCVAEYRLDMVLGKQAFYVWSGPGMPAVLCISHDPDGRWALHELKGPRNAGLPIDQFEEIRNLLQAAGINPKLSVCRTLSNFRMAQMHHFHDIRFAPD